MGMIIWSCARISLQVRDVATLDDIVTLDSMDDDLPKRRKRDANAQANDDSCSDSDDD